jgi:hypothetical protein
MMKRGGVEMSEWQPIETAPKDGTPIDVYIIMLEERYPDVYFDSSVGFFCWDIEGTGKRIIFDKTSPSHWMPIPLPPQSPSSIGEQPAHNREAGGLSPLGTTTEGEKP